MRRQWFIIHDGKYLPCEFVSVNAAKGLLVLKYTGINVKITYSPTDYASCIRGKEINAEARSRKQAKKCKIVFT